ncbi:Putative excisionase (fragment) [uncultured Paludibacter sp.]|uniref:Excisionase n=1 Tax=uncultured Paludibacter sp. TaxID=497635 RepID=A0A653AKH1_9BACT
MENQNLLSQKDVLTFDEACIYTGLSRSYMYKLTHQHKVPHSKPFGKMIYFDRNELNKWLLQNKVAQMQEV